MAQSESTASEAPPTEDAVTDQLESLFASDEDTADSETAKPAKAGESEDADSEQAPDDTPDSQDDEEAGDEEAADAPPTVKVKVDGKDIEITLDEALKGYSRTADYTRKTQALAEDRKKLDAEAAGIREARQRYDAGLAQIEASLKEVMPEEPNWDELRAQYPAEQVNAAWINFQRHKEQLATVRAEREKNAQQAYAEQAENHKRYVAVERDKLFEVIPDLKDETKGKALKAELTDFALGRGFTLDELNNTADHRSIVLLHDAMQYHKLVAKQKQVSKKVDEQISKTAQPGAGKQGKAAVPGRVERAKAKLANSGSDDDAAELLLAIEASRK